MSARPFDLILFGASGYTGQLVAKYLHSACQKQNFSWALAGRNKNKLLEISQKYSLRGKDNQAVPLLIANAHDQKELDNLAAQGQTIISTVGPYLLHGEPLVRACVKAKTHYVDLCGEVLFIHKMIEKYHEEAKKNRVKIVHSCGFDSLPSDIGVLLLQEKAQQKFSKPCEKITFYLKKVRGGFSGGTLLSITNLLEHAKKNKSARKIISDPYSLYPKNFSPGLDHRDSFTVSWDKTIKSWTAPFLMAGINTRIVRRTNALLNFPYGKNFRYNEVMATKPNLKGYLHAIAIKIGILSFFGLVSTPLLGKKLVNYFIPAPGTGPAISKKDEGFFSISLVGTKKNISTDLITLNISCNKDPGYSGTAIMLAECGIILANNFSQEKQEFGVITPAAAFGSEIKKPLEKAGFSFSFKK